MEETSNKREQEMSFSCVAHGTLNAALMACEKLEKALKEWGMVMNPHDPYVCNVEQMKKQLTLLFHVYDVFLAHLQPQAVANHMKLLNNLHGEKDPLTVIRGKMHEHLILTLDFREKGSIVFS